MRTLEKYIDDLGLTKDELIIDHNDGRLYITVTDSAGREEKVYLPETN